MARTPGPRAIQLVNFGTGGMGSKENLAKTGIQRLPDKCRPHRLPARHRNHREMLAPTAARRYRTRRILSRPRCRSAAVLSASVRAAVAMVNRHHPAGRIDQSAVLQGSGAASSRKTFASSWRCRSCSMRTLGRTVDGETETSTDGHSLRSGWDAAELLGPLRESTSPATSTTAANPRTSSTVLGRINAGFDMQRPLHMLPERTIGFSRTEPQKQHAPKSA
jgi:hypothetical protein